MNVGIVGLGLIGGSFAKAYNQAGHTVYAYDVDKTILSFSMLSNVVEGELDKTTIKKCQLIFLAVLPEQAVKYFEANAHLISTDAVVMDCCGTKKLVCDKCFTIAKKYGITFVGGHPMAGTHKSGFKNSREDMFVGAPMVIVPPVFDNAALLECVEKMLSPAGFGSFSVTTAEEHDRIISFTSQMPHIISNAFIKSPTALQHRGFSAGSYKDLTRVAWLNSEMWSNLFMNNSDNLLYELDFLIKELSRYKNAILNKDKNNLKNLLEEGKERKETIDG